MTMEMDILLTSDIDVPGIRAGMSQRYWNNQHTTGDGCAILAGNAESHVRAQYAALTMIIADNFRRAIASD